VRPEPVVVVPPTALDEHLRLSERVEHLAVEQRVRGCSVIR
jgi:hypothetical protein